VVKCPIKGKEVGCDGVCEAVSSNGGKFCPVRLKALDLALNGGHSSARCFVIVEKSTTHFCLNS
jgi:hypothetical protein